MYEKNKYSPNFNLNKDNSEFLEQAFESFHKQLDLLQSITIGNNALYDSDKTKSTPTKVVKFVREQCDHLIETITRLPGYIAISILKEDK